MNQKGKNMNKTSASRNWIYLPLVFTSVTILATQVGAAPTTSQQYQEPRQVGAANYNYVGGRTQIGGYITDEGDVSADINHVFSETENTSSSVGLWAGYDIDDSDGIDEGGVQLNHNWVSRDKAGNATHVNKAFAAYDRNRDHHSKATVGYGQERENLFWEGHVSKGLSGKKKTSLARHNGREVFSKAYDYGVGGSIGKFIEDSNMRIRAGLDYEWGDDVAAAFNGQPAEDKAYNTTLSAGIEKFFQGTPHSVSLDLAASKKGGGTEVAGFDDSDLSASIGYHYDFGGASIYQPDRKYRRVRVEVPGQARPAKYARQPVYKRVPTYKTVPVYGKKTVKKAYKQLVKTTMELEGQTFFKLNSARLIPSAQTRLKQIAGEIRKTGYRGAIRITGNTCGLGDAKYDQILSEKRARAVRDFMIKQGFNPETLIARGLGKSHPKYPNTPDQGFKNRRVDIEYVTEQKNYKTAYRTEQQTVRTGTRKVVSGFKNVPAGYKNVLIDSGAPGTPRVIWKTEVVKSSPAWIRRALHNNIRHDRNVNTYYTTAGSQVQVPLNVAPVAHPDNASVACNQPVTINVLGNDTDADNDALTITGFTQPDNGMVEQVGNQLVYTSNGLTCGVQDSFAYTISDGNGHSVSSTVTIDVSAAQTPAPPVTPPTTPENSDPDALDDHAEVKLGEQTVYIDVLNNDSDPDDDPLIITDFTNGSNGAIKRGNNGVLIYTANEGFSGTDTFTYTISDGHGGVDSATVTVIVPDSSAGAENVAPVAVDDKASTRAGQVVKIDVLNNDSDVDGDSLSIKDFTQPANGSVIIANNKLVYRPDDKFMGMDRFSYTISDGHGHTATATVKVTVGGDSGCNVDCTIAKPDSVNTTEGNAVAINPLANDEGKGLKIGDVDDPAHGAVVVHGKTITYTPAAGFTGVDTFWYQIIDSTGYKDSAKITVTVKAHESSGGKNVAPVAVDDAAVTLEDQPVDVDVLDNDYDDDGDSLKIESFTQAANGAVSVAANGSLRYAPKSGYSGADSFSYTIVDGNGHSATANVNIKVKAKDRPDPVVTKDDTASTVENKGIVIGVLDNDSSGLTITGVSQPANGFVEVINGNKVSYLPDDGFSGVDSFSYQVKDAHGQTGQAFVKVTVKPAQTVPNRAPDAVEDAPTTTRDKPITVDVLSNDTDPDGDALTIISITQPQQGSASIVNNKIAYDPMGHVGSMSITYTISDGHGHTDSAVLTIAVTDPNDGNIHWPVIKDENVTVHLGESILIDVLANDFDLDGDVLVLDEVDQGSLGIVEKVNGKIRYTPLPGGETGTDVIYYGVHDGHGHNGSGKVTITVVP